ncbi:MAG: class I SAM-dependent methyltransferase [Candidatus Micrarchaeia archaeon]
MFYYCTRCGKKLKKTKKGYSCKCGFFAKSNGYIDFIENSTPYWGEISEEGMSRVLRVIKKEGEKGFISFMQKNFPKIIPYIYNTSRISFVYHIPKKRFENVLDIGSGWGSLAFMLSKFSKKVYSVESVEERIKFQEILKKERKIKNITLIRADANNLPFKEKIFDLIVVNGLLEWVGYHAKNHNHALELQVKFLKNVSKLLKDDGFLYIGIENRIGIQYFLGTKDHIGVRFASLLPRLAADFVCKVLKGKSYTTLTHTYNGYKNLLKEANLKSNFYWVFPTYNFPKFSGDYEEATLLRFFDYIKNNEEEAKVWLNVANIEEAKVNKKLLLLSKLPKTFQRAFINFVPAFQIIAYKKSKPSKERGFYVASEKEFKAKFVDLKGKTKKVEI